MYIYVFICNYIVMYYITLSTWKCYLSFQHFSWFSVNYPLITEKGIQTSRHNCEFQLPWTILLGLVLCVLELYLSLNVYTHRNSGFILLACLFEKNTTFKTWAYVLQKLRGFCYFYVCYLDWFNDWFVSLFLVFLH